MHHYIAKLYVHYIKNVTGMKTDKLVPVSHDGDSSDEMALPYFTLPPGWAGSYTCPALRPYQFGPMRIPECNHKVTGSGYKAVNSYEAVNRRL